MYLKKCFIKNMGPINELNFNFPFKGNKPIPIVFVGKNGAGKSIILSHIVDALCEMGKSVYEDVIKSNSEFKKPFLRLVGPINQKMGEKFGIALLNFGLLNEDNVGISYVEKTGDLDFNVFFPNKNGDFPGLNSWNNTENFKALGSFNTEKFDLKQILHEGAYAYFPVTRRETPHWLNPESLEENIGPNIYKRINGRLNKQIFVETATNINRQWILDLCLDSMVFISKQGSPNQYQLQSDRTSDLNSRMLQIATISSVEKILKTILQDDNACFFLNPRNSGHFRLGVKNNERHLIPSLDHLSSGQASLFNIFTTLIRYADLGNSSGVIDLTKISGVVIIDEIDAHAHSDLQYQVIPKLINMFPKIQFIMTSHEPLLLMGLVSSLERENIQIVELPEGEIIDVERFSEFKKAFDYYQNTKAFEDNFKNKISSLTKPIILMEGKTDVQYLIKAIELIHGVELLQKVDIVTAGEVSLGNGKGQGKDALHNIQRVITENNKLAVKKIMLIYDCDVKDVKPLESEMLEVRKLLRNEANEIFKSGIENLLPNELSKEIKDNPDLVTRQEIGNFLGEVITKPFPNKQKIADHVCDIGNLETFENFRTLVDDIAKFVGYQVFVKS